MPPIKRMLMIGVMLFGVVLVVVLAWLGRPSSAVEQRYGLTFSSRQATDLGLDPQETYRRLLDELSVKRLRLAAYWDVIEPVAGQYDFTELDWQIEQAATHRAEVMLAIGRKLPRWPECFVPAWVSTMTAEQQKAALLQMVQTVVKRYQDNPAVTTWQLENEPFVTWFGHCPSPDPELLRSELAIIRGASPKPVIITDSGELSLWGQAAHFGDLLGVTMYRVTWNKWLGYGHYFLPAWSYRAKARLRGLEPSAVLITELQAEPWPPGTNIVDTAIPEQLRSMDMKQFMADVALAKASGLGDAYLWGAEWWYWMKLHGYPEFWDAARVLMVSE